MLIEAVRKNNSDGLIVSGFGSGTLPPTMMDAAARATRDGIPVVLASRSTAGRTVITPRISKLELLVADNLHPQKARILLMVALTITKDRKLLQQMFAEY